MSSNVSYYLIVVSSFLIQLLPIFFISGPAIPDIVVTSIAIIFLYYLIYKKKIYLFKDYVIYYLFIIFLYINFNSLFSEYIYVSFKYSIGFIRVIIFSVALYFILTKNKKLISNFYYVFLGCVIFLFLDSSLQSITGSNILGYKPLDKSRMTSFFLNEQIMGSYVARLLPLAIGLFYIINKNKSLTFFLILISGAVVFLSGERTSLAYFLIIFNLSASVNAVLLSKKKGCDVAVCGHIHQPELKDNYMNSGDWCENCTALVETKKGTWKIIEFHKK
jgi:hypothetical protein